MRSKSDRFHVRPFRAALVGLAVACAAHVPAGAVDWALYERGCQVDGAGLVVSCGEYGAFHFEGSPTSSCQPVAAGAEDPPVYGGHGQLAQFPGSVVMLDEMLQVVVGRAAGATSPVTTPPPAQLGDPALDVVIDFLGAHGISTTWLVDRISGPGAAAAMLALDDAALAPLGDEVGDFHVLASLCRVLDEIHLARIAPPRTINMSFGRATVPGDDDGADDCLTGRASCQIARVVARLRQGGSRLVAAGGNHRELLFPASLDDVAGVGMLELNAFLDRGQAKPAWQTPPRVDAWTPGNALCLRHWPAPAGSSYSSALFAGWVSSLLDAKPGFDPLVGGPWWPAWHEGDACYRLTNGTASVGACNGGVDAVIAGLAGANAGVCWFADELPALAGPGPADPIPAEPLPSLPTWTAETSPTPEADPCVPCVARFVTLSPDVRIDMSQSSPLPTVMVLDDVRLQIGTSSYPLDLDDAELDAIENGALAELQLPGWGPLLTPAGPLSLWYRFKPSEETDCAIPGACYWSSTPVLVNGAGP